MVKGLSRHRLTPSKVLREFFFQRVSACLCSKLCNEYIVDFLKCVKMLDHVMIKVKDWPRAKAYYETTLPHIGYELFWSNEKSGGFQGPDAPHGRIYIVQGMYNSAVRCRHPPHVASQQCLLTIRFASVSYFGLLQYEPFQKIAWRAKSPYSSDQTILACR